jgi:MFS family permease
MINTEEDELETVTLLSCRQLKPKFPTREFVVALSACLGVFCNGLSLGFSFPTADAMQTEILKTQNVVSWFGSLVLLGVAVGGPVGTILVEKAGRKTTMMICAVTLVIGWLVITY